MSAVHAIMDAIVDDYLAANAEIERDIDEIEEMVFSPHITEDSQAIYRLKRENLELRRAVSPLVPVARLLANGTLAGMPGGLRTHFHDVGDHLLRANDNADAADALLLSVLQASNARQSLQQNTDMRKIAAYAAMLAVPTAIAGIYGMNFEHMPELHVGLGLSAGPGGHGPVAGLDVPGVQALRLAVAVARTSATSRRVRGSRSPRCPA